jgi:hypothetical protein
MGIRQGLRRRLSGFTPYMRHLREPVHSPQYL